MAVAPIYVEIAIHYWTRAGEFERLTATACADVVAVFVECGLLEKLPEPNQHGATFKATNGMGVWVNAICCVPFPIKRWTIEKDAPQ